MADKKSILKAIVAIDLLTILLTVFFYWHESFPKPLRAITAVFGVPTALASGLSHYLGLGIPVYETPWAIVLANLIAAVAIVWVVQKWLSNRKNKQVESHL